jgi:hypothetical protein
MSPASKPIARALLGAAMAAMAAGALAVANPEPLDLDPDILAEIARQRARATTHARLGANAGRAGKGSTTPTAECGSLSIGNVVGGGRIGFSPIDVNVVIVGDVINANNRCR